MVRVTLPGCLVPAQPKGAPPGYQGAECVLVLARRGEVGRLWHLEDPRAHYRTRKDIDWYTLLPLTRNMRLDSV